MKMANHLIENMYLSGAS